MKKVTVLERVVEVRQLVQVDKIETVNVLLASGDWIFINSYSCNNLTSKRPVYTLGKIK